MAGCVVVEGSLDIAVLEDPAAVAVAVEPVRARLLRELAREPGSAAGLAARLEMPRQRLGYHLKSLADHGLAVEVEQRRHGGLTERLFSASASSYAISPVALGQAGSAPNRIADRLSAAYLIAVAARAVGEVGSLIKGAAKAGKRLPTITIDADIRFRTAASRAAFAEELGEAVRQVVARHHDESTPGGRWYRLAAFAYPMPKGQGDDNG